MIDFLSMILALWLPVVFGQWDTVARDEERFRSEFCSLGSLTTGLQQIGHTALLKATAFIRRPSLIATVVLSRFP